MTNFSLRQPDPIVRWPKLEAPVGISAVLPDGFMPSGGVIVGGETAAALTSCTDNYNREQDVWRRLMDLPDICTRGAAETTSVRGSDGIHCVGGNRGYVGYSQAHHRLENGAWLRNADLPEPGRVRHCSSRIYDYIYIMAGYRGSPYERTNRNDRYDPPSDSWTERAWCVDVEFHNDAEAITFDDALYVIGGSSPTYTATDWVRKFQDVGLGGTWTTLSERLNHARLYHAAEALEGYGFAFAGYDGVATELTNIEKFNPSTTVWSMESAELDDPTYGLASFALDSTIHLMGGLAIIDAAYVRPRTHLEFTPGQALVIKQDMLAPGRDRLKGATI